MAAFGNGDAGLAHTARFSGGAAGAIGACAVEALGVSPARCLVFEDSDTGAEAAHRAGCTVVQVPDTAPTTGPFAHFVAPDLLTGAQMAGLPLTLPA